MGDPQEDIHSVATILLRGSREEQHKLINQLFTADSSFSHPFLDCTASSILLTQPEVLLSWEYLGCFMHLYSLQSQSA